jgi:hypothetical protein
LTPSQLVRLIPFAPPCGRPEHTDEPSGLEVDANEAGVLARGEHATRIAGETKGGEGDEFLHREGELFQPSCRAGVDVDVSPTRRLDDVGLVGSLVNRFDARLVCCRSNCTAFSTSTRAFHEWSAERISRSTSPPTLFLRCPTVSAKGKSSVVVKRPHPLSSFTLESVNLSVDGDR